MKYHEKAKFINDLTEIAKMYGHTEQLRERISHLVHDVLEKENKIRLFSSDLDVFAKMGFEETANRISVVLNKSIPAGIGNYYREEIIDTDNKEDRCLNINFLSEKERVNMQKMNHLQHSLKPLYDAGILNPPNENEKKI